MINGRYLWPSDKPLVVLECGWQNKLDTTWNMTGVSGL